MLTVTNSKGINFNVRVVHAGQRYGAGNCLVHGETKWDGPDAPPLVCFYDARYIRPQNNWEYGQPVSYYYTSTILDDQQRLSDGGLDLHGGVPGWEIDGKAMGTVIDYIKKETSDERD
jgi:hypothetical protein